MKKLTNIKRDFTFPDQVVFEYGEDIYWYRQYKDQLYKFKESSGWNEVSLNILPDAVKMHILFQLMK